jgi:hypothetical protein
MSDVASVDCKQVQLHNLPPKEATPVHSVNIQWLLSDIFFSSVKQRSLNVGHMTMD